jgi:hypothetical protein
VESLTLVTRCGKTFLFVGAERTSTIFIFDITDPKNVKLESHISIAGNISYFIISLKPKCILWLLFVLSEGSRD